MLYHDNNKIINKNNQQFEKITSEDLFNPIIAGGGQVYPPGVFFNITQKVLV